MMLQSDVRAPEQIEVAARQSKPLKIGYAWQYDGWKDAPSTATMLHVRGVVSALLRRGHQVRLVTVRDGQPHWSDDLEHWHPIETRQGRSRIFRLFEGAVRGVQNRLHLPYLRLFESYRFAGACADALSGYDLIYERFWVEASGGLMAARQLHVPIFYEVNGDLVAEYKQLGILLSPAQWSAIHLVTRQMFLRSARVVAVTEPLRETTLQRWRLPASKVSTVNNGAQVDLFIQPVDSQAVRERYALGTKPVIMFVGGFKPWHGIDLLVEAFALLKEREPQAMLVLVGDGPLRAETEAQVGRLQLSDQVIFTGAVPHEQVAAYLGAAQVVVVNPRQSQAAMMGNPLKLFEYMAAGKAIVAPQLPNIARILTDHETALLVPPDDARALASALAELVTDESLRNRLGEAAREQALSRHSWESTVDRLEAIFQEELDPDR